MELNYIFCNEILYYISRKNAILIKIANSAQTVIMAKIFNRNVRSKKYFNNPKQYSTFRSLCKMPTDSLRAYPGGQPYWFGKNSQTSQRRERGAPEHIVSRCSSSYEAANYLTIIMDCQQDHFKCFENAFILII